MIKKILKIKGYTIIEMLIVITIITIVASIGVNTYQAQRKQTQYNDSILKVLTMIKTARNYAVSSRSVFDECNIGKESYVPPEGYGVYINQNETLGQSRFVLFANTEIDNAIEMAQFEEEIDPCASDLIEEEYFLHDGTIFSGLLTDLESRTPLNLNANEAVIIFRPPLAEAYIAANDHPPIVESLIEPDDLYLEFNQVNRDDIAPFKYIHINRVAGFPEMVRE